MEKEKNLIQTEPHKCLLYWHHTGGGSIPIGKNSDGTDLRMLVRCGYNSFDSEHLTDIIKQCKDYIDAGIITLWGVKISSVDGKAKEVSFLNNISATELREIIKQTTNLETLADLGNPDYVGIKNQDFAASRIEEISNYTGNTGTEQLDVIDGR